MRFLATRRFVFLVLFSFLVAFSGVANSSAVGLVGLSVQMFVLAQNLLSK